MAAALPTAVAKDPRDLDEPGIAAPDALQRIEKDGKEGGEDDKDDLGALPDPEPEDEHRNHRHRRDVAQKLQGRVQLREKRRKRAAQKRKRDGKRRGEAEADGDTAEAGAHILRQRSVCGGGRKGAPHRSRRGQQKGVPPAG